MDYTNEDLKARSDRLSLLGWIAIKILVPVLVVIGLVYFVILVLSPEYKVTVLKPPKAMVEKGFSQEVIAQMFAGELTHLQDLSNTGMEGPFLTDKPLIDFQIPKTSFSFQSLIDWTKNALHHPDTVVTIGLTEDREATSIHVSLADPAGHTRYLTMLSDISLERLFSAGAAEVLQALDPLVSGAAKLQAAELERRKGNACATEMFADALKDLEAASQDANWRVAYRANVSLSHLYAVTGEHTVAVLYAEAAARRGELSINQLETRLLRGVEYTALARHEAASADFAYVIQRAPQAGLNRVDRKYLLSFAYQDWASDVAAQAEEQGKATHPAQRLSLYRTAIEYLKHALDHNPGNDGAKRDLARAYWFTDQEPKADALLTALLETYPSDPQLHKDYANALRDLSLREYQHSHAQARPSDCRLFAPAIDQYRLAISLARAQQFPEPEAQAHHDLGVTYEACGDSASAEAESRPAPKSASAIQASQTLCTPTTTPAARSVAERF